MTLVQHGDTRTLVLLHVPPTRLITLQSCFFICRYIRELSKSRIILLLAAVSPLCYYTYYMLGTQMLDAWISFLRHSPRHFPEGNLVHMISPVNIWCS